MLHLNIEPLRLNYGAFVCVNRGSGNLLATALGRPFGALARLSPRTTGFATQALSKKEQLQRKFINPPLLLLDFIPQVVLKRGYPGNLLFGIAVRVLDSKSVGLCGSYCRHFLES